MPVLSRKIGNRIVIAGNVEITVLEIHGNRLRLEVNAPRHVSIERIVEVYRHPNMTSDQIRAAFEANELDPLKEFSAACLTGVPGDFD